MKKIKIAFAALTAVVGIGGAYATTHQASADRVGTIYRWHTLVGNNVLATTTIPNAQFLSGCNGQRVNCLRGTVQTIGGAIVTVFLKKG
ncbi:hypothetical protein [Chitinophaga sp.]|uniref:hypothetical protein n=1 Tax=Chitinophaga sp. TaxID=1869181 RepID=UPI0031D8BB95